MPTIQESNTHDLIQSACKKYINSQKNIDWEQRRYEIARDLYIKYSEMTPEDAVSSADELIEQLRN